MRVQVQVTQPQAMDTLEQSTLFTDAVEEGKPVCLPFGVLQASWENKTESHGTAQDGLQNPKRSYAENPMQKSSWNGNELKLGGVSHRFNGGGRFE